MWSCSTPLPIGPLWQCRVRDGAASGAGGEDFLLTARSVVNATGPWAAAIPHSRLRLRLTKGVHLVIDRRRLPLPSAVVMTAGSRILFGIPWGERVILGTTDTDYEGPPEAVTADEADVDYILEIVNASFPDAALTPADVIRTWAGVRPLIDTGQGGPSDISRAHQIRMPEPGWFDVAGGKLTTYRRIAQQVVDRVVRYQGRKAEPCRTATEPLRVPGQDQTLERHPAPAGPSRPGRALLPPRMGHAPRRRDDSSHELALLSCRRRKDCSRGRRLDGRRARVGCRTAGGGNGTVW